MNLRNTVVRWLWDEKPTASDTSTTEQCGLRNSSHAFATRCSVRYRWGVFPVASLNTLRKLEIAENYGEANYVKT